MPGEAPVLLEDCFEDGLRVRPCLPPRNLEALHTGGLREDRSGTSTPALDTVLPTYRCCAGPWLRRRIWPRLRRLGAYGLLRHFLDGNLHAALGQADVLLLPQTQAVVEKLHGELCEEQ